MAACPRRNPKPRSTMWRCWGPICAASSNGPSASTRESSGSTGRGANTSRCTRPRSIASASGSASRWRASSSFEGSLAGLAADLESERLFVDAGVDKPGQFLARSRRAVVLLREPLLLDHHHVEQIGRKARLVAVVLPAIVDVLAR